MMGEEWFAVAVADAYSRVTQGKQIGVCTVMANLNAAGIQEASMSAMARAVGWYGEMVSEPSEVIPALNRSLAANAEKRPAFLELICSQHPVHGGWVGR
jgi:thiamine pyrophosphate-dependent acetolactate synthase large subunit-like protein